MDVFNGPRSSVGIYIYICGRSCSCLALALALALGLLSAAAVSAAPWKRRHTEARDAASGQRAEEETAGQSPAASFLFPSRVRLLCGSGSRLHVPSGAALQSECRAPRRPAAQESQASTRVKPSEQRSREQRRRRRRTTPEDSAPPRSTLRPA